VRTRYTDRVTLQLQLRRGRAAQPGRTHWPLTGEDVVVGAAPECDCRLADGVAARHCQFGWRQGMWLVVDLGGGTALNGRPLDRPAPVGPGDVVTIGGCELAVAATAESGAGGVAALLAAAGLSGEAVAGSETEVLAAAGALLRRLVDGLVAQLAARARAKADIGAAATMFSPGGLNPLKALPGDRALAALLDPGGMAPDRAVDDAFADLEAHHAATLAAMQQALAATLDRFSPTAIRGRAQDGGLMARVLPHAREAALWSAYEREFDGVVKGSSDAFVEMFAREFGRAYRSLSSAPRRPS